MQTMFFLSLKISEEIGRQIRQFVLINNYKGSTLPYQTYVHTTILLYDLSIKWKYLLCLKFAHTAFLHCMADVQSLYMF